MIPDLHALISQMAAELDHCQQLLMDDRRQRHPLADHARALLAEPVAEGPTDEELEEEFGAALLKLPGDSMNTTAVAFARAVLARWGRPAAAPVPEPGEVPRIGHILRLAEIIREVDGKHDKGAAALAEAILSHPGIRSAGLTAALAQPVAEGPTDEDLVEALRRLLMWPPRSTEAACEQDYTFARAVLARWGRPTPQPVPEPGEVAELVKWLHRRAAEVQAENCTTIYSPHLLRRVADLLGQRYPAPPADGVAAEVAAWLRLFCSEEYESLGNSHDPDVAWLTRAAELLEQRHLAPPGEERIGNWLLPEKPPLPEHWSGDLEYGFETAWETARALLQQRYPTPVPVSELPQGWHMLCDIEPEPGAMCDWVIMAPWGCDHGSGEWRDYDGVSPCEFLDVPVGWSVRYKGFANADGVMVSDPELTAWRMLSLPTMAAEARL